MKKIIKDLLKKYSLLMFFEILIISVNIYLTTVPSEMVGKIIDLLYDVVSNKQNIIKILLILMLSCFAILITRISWKMINNKIERDSMKKLNDIVYEKMLKTEVSKLQLIKNGEIMTYFVKDIKEIKKFLSVTINIFARFILNFVIVSFAMVKVTNLKLTVLTMFPICVSVILIINLRKRLERYYNTSRENFMELSQFVQESTDSIRTTKAYVGEQSQYNEFLKKNSNVKNINLKLIKNESLLNVYVNLGMGIGTVIAIFYGSYLVLQNIITIGDFVSFIGFIYLLKSPIMWLPWLIKHIKKVQVSYKRLNEMLNLAEEKIEVNGKLDNENLKGNIEIKNLTYNYPGCLEKVLEDINISIQPGKSLGIIGVIGSGKTTLMNLLLKLYNVENGKIFIDGKDINEIDTEIVRNNICYITQDNFLFSASLKENINLFRDIYDDKYIEESTKLSMIYDEIYQMKDGIDTVIGEKGIDLSGGQKQRVVISRAFLNNSNVVILDDTFSALDNRTEQSVLNNIKELTKDKTCIIVSNRVSDIKHCDEIVVLEHGRIVERGVHSSLIDKRYKYYEFYRNQAERGRLSILG